MERLTQHTPVEFGYCEYQISPHVDEEDFINRLGTYEDIADGLPLDRLREICAAERDGRCVVLPCKVGETVYAPFRKEVKEYKIERVDIRGICFDSEDGAWIFLKHIQDGTVFLTRAEADAALQKEAQHE